MKHIVMNATSMMSIQLLTSLLLDSAQYAKKQHLALALQKVKATD